MSGNISITHTGRHYKMSVGRSSLCLPRLALLDPEMLYALPVGIAAAAGMDALSHAVEGYLSPRASAFSDMIFANALAEIVIAATGGGNGHAMARALGGQYYVHVPA